MTKLFNKGGDGAGEIVRVLGLIDNDLDFTKWEPILPLGIRDLQAIIGTEPIDAVDKYYREDHADGTEPDSDKACSDYNKVNFAADAAGGGDVYLVKGYSHFGRTTRNGRTWQTSWRE